MLTTHVYRLADLANKSEYVLLPGEATMYVGTDFVGRMNLPLVAIGEQYTVGFGVDPQLQVTPHAGEEVAERCRGATRFTTTSTGSRSAATSPRR